MSEPLPHQDRWSRWLLPALVFLLFGAATLTLWHRQKQLQDEELLATANRETAAHTTEIAERLKLHAQFLRSLQAFAVANGNHDIAAWQRFARQIDVARNLPGLVAFAYAPAIPARQAAGFAEQMRRREGHPDFTIFPEPQGEISLPVVFVAPEMPLQHAALGFDLLSDPARREVIATAIASRDVALSGRTVLVFDRRDQRPGFLLLQAVYRSNQPTDTLAQRQRAFSGVVLTAYRMDEFMQSLSGKFSNHFALQILDDGASARPANEQPPALVFNSLPSGEAADNTRLFHHELEFGNRNWILHFRLLPNALDTQLIDTPSLILLGGLLTGSLLAFLVFHLTTHRARAERHAQAVTEQLRRSEERFRLAAAGTNDGLWDQNLQTGDDYISPRMAEILGFTSDETPASSAFYLGRVHPEDQARRCAALRRHFRERAPYDVEIRLQRKDGRWAWVRLRGEAVRDYSGKPLRIAGSVSDISHAKEIEGNLERLRRLLSTIIASIPLPVFVVDSQRRLLMINLALCRLLDHDESALLGCHWLEKLRCPPVDRRRLLDLGELVLGGGEGETLEFTLLRSDGSPGRAFAHFVGAHSPEGEALLIATLNDVTDLRQAEAELREHRDHLRDMVNERTARLDQALQEAQAANVAKSEFLANMSHELRTPMHAILSFSKLGHHRADNLQEGKLAGYFERIGQSAQRLLGLINELLDLAKLEAGRVELQRSPTDLLPLLHRCAAQLEPLIQTHHLQLLIEASAAITTVLADPKRIEQVIFNLLANAIKFSPAGGNVRIELSNAVLPSRDGQSGMAPLHAVTLRFIDQGIGIPPGEEERIFEKFVQSSSTKTGAGGTGLGLAICREIVGRHRGTITATNNPNGGACITVTLPLEIPMESSC